MAEKKEDQWPTERWVCTGKAWLKGMKPGLTFSVIEVDGTLGRELAFEARKMKATVGHTYTIEVQGELFRPGTLKWEGTWPDKQQRAAWETKARAFDIEKRARDAEKKATSELASLEVLAPLRRLYVRADPVGKLALEVQVLAFLRGYKSAEGKLPE